MLCSTDGPQEVSTPLGSDLSLPLGVWVLRPLETRSSLEAEQPWGPSDTSLLLPHL